MSTVEFKLEPELTTNYSHHSSYQKTHWNAEAISRTIQHTSHCVPVFMLVSLFAIENNGSYPMFHFVFKYVVHFISTISTTNICFVWIDPNSLGTWNQNNDLIDYRNGKIASFSFSFRVFIEQIRELDCFFCSCQGSTFGNCDAQ